MRHRTALLAVVVLLSLSPAPVLGQDDLDLARLAMMVGRQPNSSLPGMVCLFHFRYLPISRARSFFR